MFAGLCLLVANLNSLGAVGLLQLGNDDAENTVLQAGTHVLLVNTVGEGEAACELANAAFGHPIGVFGLVLADFLAARGGDLSRRLAVLWLWLLLALAALLLLAFSRLRWSLTFFSDMLGATLDGQGLLVGKFDAHVLLLDARQFAFKDVAVLLLLDIELGVEALLSIVGDLLEFGEGVVEELEEGSELVSVVGDVGRSEAWEERHVSCLDDAWFGNARCGA